MATLLATLKLAGADSTLKARLGGTFRIFKQTVDEELIRRHGEATLQSLDKRILHDAGIESHEEETKPEEDADQLSGLRWLFSGTRFAK